MQWLDSFVHSFIMAFGVTQPTPEKKRFANIFIGSLLLIVLLGFVGVIFFGLNLLAR